MNLKGVVIGIVFLIIYIVVVIPLSPYLLSIVIDFINNSDLLVWRYETVRYVYNSTTNSFDSIPSETILDFRPLIVFITQLLVYFIIPLSGIYKLVRR